MSWCVGGLGIRSGVGGSVWALVPAGDALAFGQEMDEPVSRGVSVQGSADWFSAVPGPARALSNDDGAGQVGNVGEVVVVEPAGAHRIEIPGFAALAHGQQTDLIDFGAVRVFRDADRWTCCAIASRYSEEHSRPRRDKDVLRRHARCRDDDGIGRRRIGWLSGLRRVPAAGQAERTAHGCGKRRAPWRPGGRKGIRQVSAISPPDFCM